MKFHFEVINCSNAGSVSNVHIFATYEGSDSHSNMASVLSKFYEAIERLRSEELSLIGHKVKVFLGGDDHFLDGGLGHQGSAANFPSSKNLNSALFPIKSLSYVFPSTGFPIQGSCVQSYWVAPRLAQHFILSRSMQ